MSGINHVASFCDRTGEMVKPWAEAGYSCICYDWQHSIRRDREICAKCGKDRLSKGSTCRCVAGSILYRWADLRSLTLEDMPANVAIAFAFPDCTHLSLSGARDHKRKGLRLFIDALELVESCRSLCSNLRRPWMLEQPMSRLSTAWRKPDHKFSPWMYGDDYQKETWIWAGGGFVMPRPVVTVKPANIKESIWLMPPSDERKNLRAVTPAGFARAVFDANRPRVAAMEVERGVEVTHWQHLPEPPAAMKGV